MAPPEHPFPVSELETRVNSYTQNYKEKSRKLPRDFNLKRDCALFELVQYTCTTTEQQYEYARQNQGVRRIECYPFVRLFRRCGEGEKMFHVETTAWEGEHAWPSKPDDSTHPVESTEVGVTKTDSGSQNYGSYFWSKK